jgi:hypothetical protein
MPWCGLYVAPDSVNMVSGAVSVQVSYSILGSPILVGTIFYQQALVPSPGANALGAVMSNACVGVIGP